MDASHILELIIGALAVVSAITGIGAMYALGRGSSYDK